MNFSGCVGIYGLAFEGCGRGEVIDLLLVCCCWCGLEIGEKRREGLRQGGVKAVFGWFWVENKGRTGRDGTGGK